MINFKRISFIKIYYITYFFFLLGLAKTEDFNTVSFCDEHKFFCGTPLLIIKIILLLVFPVSLIFVHAIFTQKLKLLLIKKSFPFFFYYLDLFILLLSSLLSFFLFELVGENRILSLYQPLLKGLAYLFFSLSFISLFLIYRKVFRLRLKEIFYNVMISYCSTILFFFLFFISTLQIILFGIWHID